MTPQELHAYYIRAQAEQAGFTVISYEDPATGVQYFECESEHGVLKLALQDGKVTTELSQRRLTAFEIFENAVQNGDLDLGNSDE